MESREAPSRKRITDYGRQHHCIGHALVFLNGSHRAVESRRQSFAKPTSLYVGGGGGSVVQLYHGIFVFSKSTILV